jgi:hypothetical protein
MDFGRNFSTLTDFSSPTAQKNTLFSSNGFVRVESSRHILRFHSHNDFHLFTSSVVCCGFNNLLNHLQQTFSTTQHSPLSALYHLWPFVLVTLAYNDLSGTSPSTQHAPMSLSSSDDDDTIT